MAIREYCDISGRDVTLEDKFEVSVVRVSERENMHGKPAMPKLVISSWELEALKNYFTTRVENYEAMKNEVN